MHEENHIKSMHTQLDDLVEETKTQLLSFNHAFVAQSDSASDIQARIDQGLKLNKEQISVVDGHRAEIMQSRELLSSVTKEHEALKVEMD